MKTSLKVTFLLWLLVLPIQTHGAAGELDLSFDAGSSLDRPPSGIAVQPDGKIVVAGDFSTVPGLVRHGVARLNPDGSTDATFSAGGGPDGLVTCILLQPDGKVVIGGSFTNVNGVHRTRIARLNADGTLDTTFDPGSGANDYVTWLALQGDGKILVTGYFNRMNGVSRNSIVRLNSDGSVDSTFNPGAGPDSPYVYSVILQPDGRILVGGWFSNFNGVNSGGVVRLLSNGTVDTSFNPESGGHSTTALALQPDGRVIVAGDFIERLNSDGTLDRNFRGRVDEFVQAIVLQADGKIVLGGQFHQIDGSPERPYFARLNADGTLDLSFNPAVQLYPPGIWSLALESSGTILAGAYFDAVDGVGLRKLIRLNPADGSINDTFNENRGISGPVYSAGVQADGKVLIAGFFGDVNNKRRQGIARLESNGRLDETFDPGLILNQAFYSSSNVVVYSLVVQGDGKVIIGGGFTNINGIGRNNIARLNSDGSVDETFNPGEGTDYSVYRVVLQPDGRVLISGGFNHADGTALPYFARLNADGSLDRSFQPNLGFPYAMAVEPEGQIVVAGYRITNSTAVVFVVRLNPDGSIDPGFNVGPIGGYAVNSVGVQPDGRILVGGSFNSIGGINRTNIARLNDDGSVDLSFDPGSAVQGTTANLLGSFLLQPDGKILVGATATDGVENVNVILRLNPDGTVDDSFVSLPGGWLPLALQPDARIIAGGTFSAADGTVRMWVARLFGAPPLVITVEPDDLSVKVGDTAIFHVVASGTPVLHYQWYFNGTPITDGPQISGATTATLTLKRAHFRDEGEYKVVISNDEGSVTSRTVSLRVHPGGKA